MPEIRACDLPIDALLRRYSHPVAYTDCYVTEIAGPVTHAAFVEAFYTTPVFRLERLILRLLISRPSTDAQARQLAAGDRNSFAAWAVEDRAPDQLLMQDVAGRTRSWLMVSAAGNGLPASTCLYFGSAVIPVRNGAAGERRMGWVFRALLGFHRIYSRVLLGAARSRLARQGISVAGG